MIKSPGKPGIAIYVSSQSTKRDTYGLWSNNKTKNTRRDQTNEKKKAAPSASSSHPRPPAPWSPSAAACCSPAERSPSRRAAARLAHWGCAGPSRPTPEALGSKNGLLQHKTCQHMTKNKHQQNTRTKNTDQKTQARHGAKTHLGFPKKLGK